MEKQACLVEQGDWLQAVEGLAAASVDMLYADPPFNTGARKRTPVGAARLAGKGMHARDALASYEDSWETPGAYIAWLRSRIRATLRVLRPSACVLIHCDWRACHLVRVMLDDVLGADRFVNHLIWSYGLGGSSPRRFARKHDDILLYCVHPEAYWFLPPMVPATSNRMRGMMKKATDVIEIPSLNNMSRERTGYPTQKPTALLEMLIGACCPPGGTVLDPCCGSGTTLAAACKLGRRAVGFDVSAEAVRISRGRC